MPRKKNLNPKQPTFVRLTEEQSSFWISKLEEGANFMTHHAAVEYADKQAVDRWPTLSSYEKWLDPEVR
jgi:hypothetical protein